MVLLLFSGLKADLFKTPGEETNYTRYSQYEEITVFLSKASYLSKNIKIKTLGQTNKTNNYTEKDLYLCIITEEGIATVQELNKKKPTCFIIASQHGNEQSAKEAALLLIKEAAGNKLNKILERVNLLVIPQANPFGNFYDQRRNEQNLDLNRDHVKLESPATRMLHNIFNKWKPEVTLDVHEKGYDYYQVNIGKVSNININKNIFLFSQDVVMKELYKRIKNKGYNFHEYLVSQLMGIDSSAGADYQFGSSKPRNQMLRYSTTDINDGRNSFGIYETFSFILEGASKHDIKTLKDRTLYQYCGIKTLLDIVADNSKKILKIANQARRDLLKKGLAYEKEDKVFLKMEYRRTKDNKPLVIKKLKYKNPQILGILKVPKKPGDYITRDDLDRVSYSEDFLVEERTEKNWFPRVVGTLEVTRPLGYFIPQENKEVLKTLIDHGILVAIVAKDIQVKTEYYLVNNVVPSDLDYLPPKVLELTNQVSLITIKRGDFYINCAQAAANLIPLLLEPQSHYGLIRYFKYQLVPRQGDIFPFMRNLANKKLPVFPYKNW
jgi:hypothetical protein